MTKSSAEAPPQPIRVALVVPHIFMHRDILPHVIFSPGYLALSLADGLKSQGIDVTLFTAGPVDTAVHNITADLSLFENELAGRDDSYIDLLKKHPFTFITLARQVQSELVAKAYVMANDGMFDIVHVYTNEEELALPFASLCRKPVVFTHHDPFNFLIKYKNNFPKYKHLNWISMSYAQRKGMPADTNWTANIYHGLHDTLLTPTEDPANDYVAYIGRIIEPKGVHLAIAAVKRFNKTAAKPLQLKIAGKHYADESKDRYWQKVIEPELCDVIKYVGFIDSSSVKRDFLANARALIVPSLFDEPFGMVTVEAFACGTPVIVLESGALPEVVEHNRTGFIIKKSSNTRGETDEIIAIRGIAKAIEDIGTIDRAACRTAYETRFTLATMALEHKKVYERLAAVR